MDKLTGKVKEEMLKLGHIAIAGSRASSCSMTLGIAGRALALAAKTLNMAPETLVAYVLGIANKVLREELGDVVKLETHRERQEREQNEDVGPEYDSAGFTEEDRIGPNGQYRNTPITKQ